MKMTKRILAGSFAFATAFSVVGCGSDDAADTSSEIPVHDLNEQQKAVLDKMVDTLPDMELTNKTVTWLSHYDINPSDGQSESADIYLFQQKYGGNIKWMQTTWETRYDDLAKNVMANTAPDMFPADDMDTFPMGAMRAMFQPIDDVIDLSDDLWSDTTEASDAFKFNGKHYVTVIDVTPTYACIYNTKTIRDAGFEDPYELYQNGEWDWDTFAEMCLDFTDSDSQKYALDGYWYGNAISESCGVPLIGIEDGKLVQNMSDPTIENIQTRMYDLQKNGVVYPRSDNGWAPRGGDGNGNGMATNLTLFYPMGLYALEVDPANSENFGDVEAGEIMFVPMPTNPDDDTYYVSARVNGYCLCTGATNVEGYKAFMMCKKYAQQSTEVQDIGYEQIKENYKWTDDMIEMRKELYRLAKENPVFDFQNGVSSEISTVMQSVSQATMISGGGNTTWTEARTTYEEGLQYYIDKANSSISTEPTA